MADNDQLTQLQEIAQTAFNTAPSLYANGFLNGIGMTDSYMILQTNGQSVAVINLPLAVAKTLGQNLTEMIAAYEEQTGETIPTLDQLQNSG